MEVIQLSFLFCTEAEFGQLVAFVLKYPESMAEYFTDLGLSCSLQPGFFLFSPFVRKTWY